MCRTHLWKKIQYRNGNLSPANEKAVTRCINDAIPMNAKVKFTAIFNLVTDNIVHKSSQSNSSVWYQLLLFITKIGDVLMAQLVYSK